MALPDGTLAVVNRILDKDGDPWGGLLQLVNFIPTGIGDGLTIPKELEIDMSTVTISGLIRLQAVANINNPSIELNALVGAFVGDLVLCYEVQATENFYTLYAFDTACSDPEEVPLTVDASGSGLWVAVAGHYKNSVMVAGSNIISAHGNVVASEGGGAFLTGVSFCDPTQPAFAVNHSLRFTVHGSVAGGENIYEWAGTPTGIAGSVLTITNITTGGSDVTFELDFLPPSGTGVMPTRAITAATTLTSADHCIIITSGTFTQALLPATGNIGQRFIFDNAGAGDVLLVPNGVENFVGLADYTLLAGQRVEIYSDGANWRAL